MVIAPAGRSGPITSASGAGQLYRRRHEKNVPSAFSQSFLQVLPHKAVVVQMRVFERRMTRQRCCSSKMTALTESLNGLSCQSWFENTTFDARFKL
jgi:hypothetical protein